MPQNDFSIQLEDLLLALDTYTKKIDKQLLNTSNLNHAHYKQAQDISDWARALTSLLKTYQNKETLLQSDFVAAINKEIVSVFQTNEENYHKRIDEGFTKHITEASDEFLDKTEQLNKDLKKLQTSVTNVSSNLDDAEEKISKQNVEASKQMLDKVKREFDRRLTITLASLVIVVFILSFGAMWMFIPSKAEISERQDSYNSLAKARVAHNVIKKSDGYYARVEPKGCITDESSSFYSESMLCKFK
jgi:hypothetical protein